MPCARRSRRWSSTAASPHARSRAIGWCVAVFRSVLADINRFCMQSEESARRIIDLGADSRRVTVTGSLKFDSLPVPTVVSHGRPREPVLRYFRVAPTRIVLVAGSTMKFEERGRAASVRTHSFHRTGCAPDHRAPPA
ncbi:MAG: glycosyltransferase N-terminal domain-containing protein [Chitinophagaceae bacterium]